MSTTEERIVAVLHDVVEDTPWTLEQLTAEGFPTSVTDAIDGLTRRADEEYSAFIERVAQSPLSRRVKIADLEDNLDLERLPEPSPRDLERAGKYRRALQRLKS